MSLEAILAASLIVWGILIAYVIHMDIRLRKFEGKIEDMRVILDNESS